jgi:hypothetical protein
MSSIESTCAEFLITGLNNINGHFRYDHRQRLDQFSSVKKNPRLASRVHFAAVQT